MAELDGPELDWRTVDARPTAFFRQLSGKFALTGPIDIVAVAHMVPNSLHFLPALNELGTLRLVLIKPHSRDPDVEAEVTSAFASAVLSREWARDPEAVRDTLLAHLDGESPIVLVDIGGYYSDSLPILAQTLGGRLRGVVEGTSNGIERYRTIDRTDGLPVPVLSVADSPLKYPENHLIGTSIVFSLEAILRDYGEVLQRHRATVIGFGRVGRSIANSLRGRGIDTEVFDRSPIALAEAAAQGFPVHRHLDSALLSASLVICATGNRALDAHGFDCLASGAFVATVTSGDDELDLSALRQGWKISQFPPYLTRFAKVNRHFFLINKGQAINFIHKAVVGPAIQLIEGEKIAAVCELATAEHQPGVHELTPEVRSAVAETWLDHFLP